MIVIICFRFNVYLPSVKYGLLCTIVVVDYVHIMLIIVWLKFELYKVLETVYDVFVLIIVSLYIILLMAF